MNCRLKFERFSNPHAPAIVAILPSVRISKSHAAPTRSSFRYPLNVLPVIRLKNRLNADSLNPAMSAAAAREMGSSNRSLRWRQTSSIRFVWFDCGAGRENRGLHKVCKCLVGALAMTSSVSTSKSNRARPNDSVIRSIRCATSFCVEPPTQSPRPDRRNSRAMRVISGSAIQPAPSSCS